MIEYLKYRWYVFLEALKLGIPLLGLLHSEFRGKTDEEFLEHVHKVKGRWEHWILVEYQHDMQAGVRVKALPMPERYWKEMLACSLAACRLKGRKWVDWWADNKNKMILGNETRRLFVEYNKRFGGEHSRYERLLRDRYRRS